MSDDMERAYKHFVRKAAETDWMEHEMSGDMIDKLDTELKALKEVQARLEDVGGFIDIIGKQQAELLSLRAELEAANSKHLDDIAEISSLRMRFDPLEELAQDRWRIIKENDDDYCKMKTELHNLRAELAAEREKQRWIPVDYDALKVANFWMHVKKTDYCWEWTGSKNACGYGTLHDACAHQISYRMFYGEVPAGEEIMHTCNNPACVNPGHLVSGTHKENMHYMFKLRRYSRCGKSSKYIGVSYRSDSKKWRAVLSKKSLGCFEAEVDAAKAYDKAAIEYYGAGAAINLPPATEPPEEQQP